MNTTTTLTDDTIRNILLGFGPEECIGHDFKGDYAEYDGVIPASVVRQLKDAGATVSQYYYRGDVSTVVRF